MQVGNATAISPLQFQKQLRLEEARRLMISKNLDAAEASFRVGYEPAHFLLRIASLWAMSMS
jgi:AraC-like DNA-binding protein